jgi:hypothetical protein
MSTRKIHAPATQNSPWIAIQINAPRTNIGACARPEIEARAPIPATNTYTSAVPSAVEFGSRDTGVVDNTRAIVVTSRILTVVSENTAERVGDRPPIPSASPGASAAAVQVTPTTTAKRYRYCGMEGALSSSMCSTAAASISSTRSAGTRAHRLKR